MLNFFFAKKNLNIRNTPFNQSFPVKPNLANKNLEKSKKKNFFSRKKVGFWKYLIGAKKAILLVLPIMKIILWIELSKPPRFKFQGG